MALSCSARTEQARLEPQLAGSGGEDQVNTVAIDTAEDYPLSAEPADDPMMALLTIHTGARFAAGDCGPYRIIVEGTESRVAVVAVRTVTPTCERLTKQFFKKTPPRGVRLVLFSHDDTYRRGAKALSGEDPGTPYGYYSHELRAVIMNLATGGGTLVHEMVHTYAEVDFPRIPAWLNEGLGSLFEQSSFAGGKIRGLTNWRLPGLQRVLREDPPGANGRLKRLVATSTDEFYGVDSGTNYAVARYLCYDLQQKGVLERFYAEFRKNHKADPTGRVTLERILDSSLDDYEPGWRKRTLLLRYR